MAHLHTARVLWESNTPDFVKNTYSRAHHWSFDGGQTVLASSSPSVVKVPFSDPAGIDPEEALVAAISSCHMLTFLYYAAKGRAPNSIICITWRMRSASSPIPSQQKSSANRRVLTRVGNRRPSWPAIWLNLQKTKK